MCTLRQTPAWRCVKKLTQIVFGCVAQLWHLNKAVLHYEISRQVSIQCIDDRTRGLAFSIQTQQLENQQKHRHTATLGTHTGALLNKLWRGMPTDATNGHTQMIDGKVYSDEVFGTSWHTYLSRNWGKGEDITSAYQPETRVCNVAKLTACSSSTNTTEKLLQYTCITYPAIDAIRLWTSTTHQWQTSWLVWELCTP